MRHSVVLAAAATLALGACGQSETSGATATEAASEAAPAAQESAPASPAGAAAFTAGEGPSKEFMVGTWGEGDKCEMPLTFQADGTLKDGPFEKWSLENGELSMEGAPQKLKLKVVDEKTMESQMEGGKPRTLKRC